MGLGTLESEYSANRSVKRIRTEPIRGKGDPACPKSLPCCRLGATFSEIDAQIVHWTFETKRGKVASIR